MENTAKKKRNIFIVACLLIFAGTISALCAISVNSINAYADSTNGIVKENLLEKSNFYETNTVDTSKYVIISANCSFNNINFKNERTDGYGAFLYDITEYGSQLQNYTVTMNIENVNATTVRIGVGSYSPLSLRYVTNYTTFTSNLIFHFTLTTALNNAHLYFAINAGGEIKINWIKFETGTEFTGYVPNSYSNYGYNQGIDQGIQNVYDSRPNYLYNGELNPTYVSEGAYNKTATLTNNNQVEGDFIPYWEVSGYGKITADRTANGQNTLTLERYQGQGEIRLYTWTALNGLYETNEGYIFENNEEYTITIKLKNIVDRFTEISWSSIAINNNGSAQTENWTIYGEQYGDLVQNQNEPTIFFSSLRTGDISNALEMNLTFTFNMDPGNPAKYEIEYIKIEKSSNLAYTPNRPNTYASSWYIDRADRQQAITDAYVKGYNDGQANDVIGYWTMYTENGNAQYQKGKQEGDAEGYKRGKKDGEAIANEAEYNRGKQDGIAEGRLDGTSWSGLFGAVFDAPVKVLFGTQNQYGIRTGGLLNFDLPLGNQTINLYQFATALFTILIACAVIKIVIKIIL